MERAYVCGFAWEETWDLNYGPSRVALISKQRGPSEMAGKLNGTALCTVWSLVRGYYVRRFFNARQKKKALQ